MKDSSVLLSRPLLRRMRDMRESPALNIVEALAQRLPDAEIAAVEPHIEELPKRLAAHSNITLVPLDEAVAGADIVVALVDHTQFKQADRRKLRLKEKVVIDTRGVWR